MNPDNDQTIKELFLELVGEPMVMGITFGVVYLTTFYALKKTFK